MIWMMRSVRLGHVVVEHLEDVRQDELDILGGP